MGDNHLVIVFFISLLIVSYGYSGINDVEKDIPIVDISIACIKDKFATDACLNVFKEEIIECSHVYGLERKKCMKKADETKRLCMIEMKKRQIRFLKKIQNDMKKCKKEIQQIKMSYMGKCCDMSSEREKNRCLTEIEEKIVEKKRKCFMKFIFLCSDGEIGDEIDSNEGVGDDEVISVAETSTEISGDPAVAEEYFIEVNEDLEKLKTALNAEVSTIFGDLSYKDGIQVSVRNMDSGEVPLYTLEVCKGEFYYSSELQMWGGHYLCNNGALWFVRYFSTIEAKGAFYLSTPATIYYGRTYSMVNTHESILGLIVVLDGYYTP